MNATLSTLDVLKAYLYGEAGDIGGNEHAAVHRFASQDAENGNVTKPSC